MVIIDQIRRKDYRLTVVGTLMLLGMTVLMSGLWYVQIVSSRQYLESQKNQSVRTVRIPSVRGKILDRHGAVLAEDRPAFTLVAYLEELRPHFRAAWREEKPKRKLSREETGELQILVRHQVVSNFVSQIQLEAPFHITPDQLQAHFLNLRALPMPLIKNLGPADVARFMEKSAEIPGLDVEAHPTRQYASIASAHLVGHVRRDIREEGEPTGYNYRLPDSIGKIGLEDTYDDKLRGQPGTRSMLVNNMGYRQSGNMVVPQQAGHHVCLTLDLAIQEAAFSALKNSGHKAGAAIVMDPNSGDLLAMASMPVFDPNDFVPSISSTNWQAYLNAKPTPLLYRCTQERYPPGSIFKIISGLAALESGVVKTNDFLYNPGYYELGRRKRRIKDTAAPGKYDFAKAFKKSSNTYFIHYGLESGIESIIKMGDQFFLGQRTGLLPRQEVAGQFPTLRDVRDKWYDGDTANLSIGQGRISVTPLQMALMTSAVANGGVIYWPRIVSRIEPVDPDASSKMTMIPKGKIRGHLQVRPENLKALQYAMWTDVQQEGGTGRRARIEGFDIGGKTGTAEVKSRGKRDKITWFVSYGPTENPRYAVVIMIESGVSGGKTCAPIAKQIYEALLERETELANRPAGSLASN